MTHLRSVVVVLILLCMASSYGQASEIPAALKSWEKWVLHDHEDSQCPPNFDNGNVHCCLWPSHLALDVGENGGVFTLQVTVYAPTWVALPGDGTSWPESVVAGGDAIPVTRRNGLPAIRLEYGEWEIKGTFSWNTLPEILTIPPTTGVVALRVGNREIDTPAIDVLGRLRLNEGTVAPDEQDTMTATLFRLVEDTLPMRLTTHIKLQLSGKTRPVRLEELFPENATMMELDSPLPSKLSDHGTLIVQAKPGNWDIRAVARLDGPVQTLSAGKGRYGDEVWSFKAANHLRMVRVSGASSIEPSRTRMPEEWKKYPAYLMKPDDTLSFATIRRGDPDPAPNRLNLERTWWLDFDGSGFTAHDRIHGSLSRTWHLSMTAPMKLGRVAVDGKDQLITMQGAPPSPGVQLRRGSLKLEADSRMPRASSSIPAVGWDHDFEHIRGMLHLPPGWTLFATANVDAPSHTWIQQWSLLDFFLVMIIAVSAFKIFGPKTGLLAMFTLVLIFHEPGAPTNIWLLLLGLAALTKYLPAGRFKQLIKLIHAGSVIVLIAIALPFMIQQVRTAIYPQLENIESYHFSGRSLHESGIAVQKRTTRLSESVDEAFTADRKREKPVGKRIPPMNRSQGQKQKFMSDPDALIQTGPGLPTWQWKSIRLRWDGPVDRTQQIHLWLIPPALNGFLGLARFALVFTLILFVSNPLGWRRYLSKPFASGVSAVILSAVLMVSAQTLRAETANENFPPQALLEELRQRLLAPPPCLPHCADVERLELSVVEDRLSMALQIHAMVDTAVPLPATMETWRPNRVTMDNEPVKSLSRDQKGNLWIVVPKGVHQVNITGVAGLADEIRFSFPIPPHHSRFTGTGWQARGFKQEGGIDTTVVLSRDRKERTPSTETPRVNIPSFFQATRRLHLGVQWEVTTHIRRLTGSGDPALLSIPLLENASVTTAGIEIREGAAQVPMKPEQMETSFSTAIPVSSKITLLAPTGVPWVETWILDASTIWRFDFSGLPVIHHQNTDRSWQPQWRPWPGEKISISVARPEPVHGRTVTIDHVRLDLTPGQRISQAGLTLGIRSSKGGDQSVELPEQIHLLGVKSRGKDLPVRQDGKKVTIPLTPGNQEIEIRWNQATASRVLIKTPEIKIKEAAVNADISFHMPENRWLLFAGGPRLGPAILFWSYGIVVVAIAYFLGRTKLTPLRPHQWILLGVGLTQVPPMVAIVIAGWLFALAYREKMEVLPTPVLFNLAQILIVLLTLAALTGLYIAIEGGLLGIPDMQIAGNHSTRLQLNWTQDRIDGNLPTPWVVSLPIWVYRSCMLAWSLWLALSVVSWLKWGWRCFSKGHLWKRIRWPRKTKLNDKNGEPTP